MPSVRLSITCKKIRSPHELLWTNSEKKWRVAVQNRSECDLFVSWDEMFVDPVNDGLIKQIDESPGCCDRVVAETENVTGTSFTTQGSFERRIAPHKFIRLRIPAGQSGGWIMERRSLDDGWKGFSIYDEDPVLTIRGRNETPIPVDIMIPKVKGWL